MHTSPRMFSGTLKGTWIILHESGPRRKTWNRQCSAEGGCWVGTFFFIISVFSSAPTCGTNPSFRKKGSKCLTKKTLLDWVFYSRDSAFSSFVTCKSPLFEFCCHLLWHIGPKPSPANGYMTFKHITSCLAIAKDKETHCKLRRISKNAPGTRWILGIRVKRYQHQRKK